MLHLNIIRTMVRKIEEKPEVGGRTLEEWAILTLFDRLGLSTDLISDHAQPQPPKTPQFEQDLANLINTHSLENGSDTPDHVLAEYLVGCLKAFDHSAKDQATADHAAMMEEVFYTACARRAAWFASDCLAPGQCGVTAAECENCL